MHIIVNSTLIDSASFKALYSILEQKNEGKKIRFEMAQYQEDKPL